MFQHNSNQQKCVSTKKFILVLTDLGKQNHAYFDVGVRIDLVYSITGRPACFSVEVVTLHKDGMIAQTFHPDITFAMAHQLYTFANVEPVLQWEIIVLSFILFFFFIILFE